MKIFQGMRLSTPTIRLAEVRPPVGGQHHSMHIGGMNRGHTEGHAHFTPTKRLAEKRPPVGGQLLSMHMGGMNHGHTEGKSVKLAAGTKPLASPRKSRRH